MKISTQQERLDNFRTQHPKFVECLPRIVEAIDFTLNHSGLSQLKTKADKAIFLLCNSIICEFEELMHLCSGGFGIGSMKVLRGMYEKAVTADFLMRNPNDALCFFAFHRIQDHKLKSELRRDSDGESPSFSRAERFRQKVDRKFKFKQKACKECGKAPMPSWTKKSIRELAANSAYRLVDHYGFCYQAGTFHSHATLYGVAARLSLATSGALSLVPTQEEQYIAPSLYRGHLLFLVALHILNDQFSLGMLDKLNDWNEDLRYWGA
jgi:hypothetical protein